MRTFLANVVGIIKSVFKSPFEETILMSGKPAESIGEVYLVEKGDGPPPSEERDPPGAVRVPQVFKWAFLATLLLTIIFFATTVVIANSEQPLSSQQEDLFQSCTTGWQMGFGAIIGLIGGKALR